MKNSILFIIGNPRSGTTLLRLALAANTLVSIPPECGFALWLHQEYGDSDFTAESTKSAFVDSLFLSKKFETWHIDKNAFLDFISGNSVDCYADMVFLVYKFYAAMQDKNARVFGDKNNYYIKHLERIDEIFPDNKKIFIVRDGRDVSCSYMRLQGIRDEYLYAPKLPAQVDKIALEWAENALCVENNRKKNPGTTCMVRYEDLIADPKRELGRLCRFVQVEYEPEMLNFHKHNDEPESFMAWKENTRKPINDASVNIFKKELTAEQITVFEELAGRWLDQFGYERYAGKKFG